MYFCLFLITCQCCNMVCCNNSLGRQWMSKPARLKAFLFGVCPHVCHLIAGWAKSSAELGSALCLFVDSQEELRSRSRERQSRGRSRGFAARRAAQTRRGLHAESRDWGSWRRRWGEALWENPLWSRLQKDTKIKRTENDAAKWRWGFDFSFGIVSTSGSKESHADSAVDSSVVWKPRGEDGWQCLTMSGSKWSAQNRSATFEQYHTG